MTMKFISAIIIAIVASVSAGAKKYVYTFRDTPVSEAIIRIGRDNPELNVAFIYKELDHYRTSGRVSTDDAYEALRQLVGLNPVSVIEKDGKYYIEALQHGRFRYTGRTVGSDNSPVGGATVMLLADKDSTVITYGVTDNDGHFVIPCDRKDVIAKLYCMGYQTAYRHCQTFDLGTVIMKEIPVQLKTLKVEGLNNLAYADRTVYLPSSRQRNAAQSAIDLLRQMAIPQIQINLVDNSVTTLTGSKAALFINSLPASAEELEGLRTADVKRVEYLDFPTDTRFNGNEHVVNFIVQRYEYGGYTKTTVSENFLTGLSGRASLYSKFAYKRMIYDLYAGASYLNLHHTGTSTIGRYSLTGADDVPYTITRSETLNNSHFRNNQYPVTFRAIYDSDNVQIGNTLGFVFDDIPTAYTSGSLSYSPETTDNHTFTRSEPYMGRHINWSGNYYFIFPHSWHLNISSGVGGSHTDYTYSYGSSMNGTITINNISEENHYRLHGSASLSKVLYNKHYIFTRLYGGTTHNAVSYLGTSPYDNSFADTYAGIALGYSFSNRKWNISTNASLQWERNSINTSAVNEIYPLINLSVAYSPTRRHSIQAYFHFGANYPDASQKTPNILQTNEMLYHTGNPDLQLSRQITFNLQYNWMPRNNFSAVVFARYFGEYNLYVPVFSSYLNGSALLKSYGTDGNYNRTQTGVSFNWRLLNNQLQLAAQPSVTAYRMTGYYDISKCPFNLNTSVSYYLGNFYFQLSYQTPLKTIQGNRGVFYQDRDFYQFTTGWSKAGWNIRAAVSNMFRSDWLAATQILTSPLYSETQYQYGNTYHRRLNLSVTYTFSYGKKVRQENEVGEQSGGTSAILK